MSKKGGKLWQVHCQMSEVNMPTVSAFDVIFSHLYTWEHTYSIDGEEGSPWRAERKTHFIYTLNVFQASAWERSFLLYFYLFITEYLLTAHPMLDTYKDLQTGPQGDYNLERETSIKDTQMQLSLGIHRSAAVCNWSVNAQVPYIKWHNICI
jgi:hypothetical protein